MTTGALVALGVLVWVLLSVPLALFLGRVLRMRDRQRPAETGPGEWERPGRAVRSRPARNEPLNPDY